MKNALGLLLAGLLIGSSSYKVDAQTAGGAPSVGAAYGARNPVVCASRVEPRRGPISSSRAILYVRCQSETAAGTFRLLENVTVSVGRARPANADDIGDLDRTQPVYPLRGGYTTYTCDQLTTGPPAYMNNIGKNCIRSVTTNATGSCVRTTFGDWSCSLIGFDTITTPHVPWRR